MTEYQQEIEYLKAQWKRLKPGVRVKFRSMYDVPWRTGTVVKKNYFGYMDATTNIIILWDLTEQEKEIGNLPPSRESKILTAQYFIKQAMKGNLGLIVL